MTDMIVVYITCEDKGQAENISMHLLKKRLVGCTNIIDGAQSQFFWPPKSHAIDETHETILLCKTVQSKWKTVEKEVVRLHSDDIPCIFAIPVAHVSKKYYDWLVGEL